MQAVRDAEAKGALSMEEAAGHTDSRAARADRRRVAVGCHGRGNAATRFGLHASDLALHAGKLSLHAGR